MNNTKNRVKTFNINDTWRVKRDQHGNHQPEQLREVVFKGESSIKWVTHPRYFATLPMALKDIIDIELYEGIPSSMEVSDALRLYERITIDLLEGLSDVS